MTDRLPLTDHERRRKLSTEIDALTGTAASKGSGWRLESRGEFEAVLIKERRVRHRLHLFLTVVTLGMWALIWMVLAAHSDEPKRKTISV